MGLGNSGNMTFLSINDGKIVMKAAEDDYGAVSRVNKDGKIVWEKRFGNISGLLTGISISSNVYNGAEIKSWVFSIKDDKDYQLNIMYDSRYATSLLFALCNPVVDFDQPIQINPWAKKVGDKTKTACFVEQDGDKIEWFFTKEEPRGMPEWKVLKIKGRDVWDNYDAMQFLEAFVKTHVIPQLSDHTGMAPEYTPPGDVPDNKPGYSPLTLTENDDDLPF